MLDAWLGLSWQFQILVLEPFLSVGLGVAICARFGGLPRPSWWLAFGLLWNAVVLALFISGGATTSWQHWGYIGWYLMDSALVVINRRKRLDELEPSIAIGALIVLAIPLFLLLTGV